MQTTTVRINQLMSDFSVSESSSVAEGVSDTGKLQLPFSIQNFANFTSSLSKAFTYLSRFTSYGPTFTIWPPQGKFMSTARWDDAPISTIALMRTTVSWVIAHSFVQRE